MKKVIRRRFVRVRALSLASTCVTLAVAAAPADAQPAQPDAPPQGQAASPSEQDSEIVVTGSRVRGQAPVGSTVTSLGRSDIESSSAVTIDRVIHELPQVLDLGVSENSRGQTGGSGNITYGNTVNLRGIGPYATLVLVDGHRVVNNSRSTDPSVLPSLGVERVEVLADGASAIYGSDAIAGVVNLIPRRNLNTVEAFARGGISDGGDFKEYSVGAAAGHVFSQGQIMLAYEHVERTALSGDDRAFFTGDQRPFGGGDYRFTRCAPGTIIAGGVSYAIPAGGVTQATAGSLVAGTSNLCTETARQDLIPRQTYDSLNGTATLEGGDWLTFFVDGFYSKRSFYRHSNFTNARLTVPQTNAFFVRPAGFAGASYSLDYRFTELPRNDSYGYAKSWQITPGLRVRLPHDWRLEALAATGRTRDLSSSYRGLNTGALNAALASSDPTTAFDPYGLYRTNAAVLPNLANQIFLAPTNGKLTAYEVRLNGALFTLPGGPVRMAAGYERQQFHVALGSARGAPTTPITFRNFGRDVDSFYGEIYLPIFGPGNETAGFRRLELNAAVRRDRYSDVGSTTNPKFGINWSPIRGLTLRGNYGTAFRAPTLPEIYGNSNNLFNQNYVNPAGGAPIPGVALSGQNLNLKPETATNWSVGADIEPLPGLIVNLTYFDVDYRNQVVANLSDLAILARESQFAGTGVILRGTAAANRVIELLNQGIAAVGAFPGGNPANVTVFVDGRSLNLARSITRGIDFNIVYHTRLGESDRLTFAASGTYLTSYHVAQTPAAPLLDQRNLIFRPLTFRARGSVSWDHGPFSARLLASHVGGYVNIVPAVPQNVSSYTPVDFSLTWRLNQSGIATPLRNFSITAEVLNMFNVGPPYVNIAPSTNGSGGYDATAASPIGRMFALTGRVAF
ncbi:MAG: TonB-dependent receptor [Sphingomonadaceae bacterium]|nr:TonB-dependent receptor [Sphingomonadaceae bacterium]